MSAGVCANGYAVTLSRRNTVLVCPVRGGVVSSSMGLVGGETEGGEPRASFSVDHEGAVVALVVVASS